LFARYVLAAPMIHHACPMTRPKVGGWAVPFVPRIIGLAILESMGLRWFQWLPVLAFAVPDGKETQIGNAAIRTPSYSYRLQKNFRPHLSWRNDVERVSTPTAVIVGENDELFVASAYKQCIEPLNKNVTVRLLSGLGHTAIYTNPIAMQALFEPLEMSV
jgi:non-heme chloroperoxidase